MCCCLYSQCSSIDLLLTQFRAVTIKACSMPNIEFYFPSTDLSALRKLPAVEPGGATQLSLAGLYKLPSALCAPGVPPATFWRYPLQLIFNLALMFFIRAILGWKQNCLKGIDFPGSPCPHTSQPPVLSASYRAVAHLLPTPPQPCGPTWTKHVTSLSIVDILRSLGVGRVIGLEMYIMTCVHHTEWFCPPLISPIHLESYFTLCKCKLLWVSCRWGVFHRSACV